LEKIRLGIIGAGAIGNVHLTTFKMLADEVEKNEINTSFQYSIVNKVLDNYRFSILNKI
jgi:ornithine cyclodeaminase/alanine dehydrogenase-like protein (mu-crystallin family)